MNLQQPQSSAVHRFPGWEMRVDEHLLLVLGQAVKIGRPAYKLLAALADGQGRVVSKEALIAAAWPRRVVEGNNLTVQIAALRKLLGADAIVNVSGLGYRLAVMPEPATPALVPPARAPAAAHLAPAPALFGRDADLAAIVDLLETVPMVTLVGTGGVGKTSLAQAVLASTRAGWRDGAHWIDLAALRSGVPLLPLVARALGVLTEASDPMSQDLMQLLPQLNALIVLDNCEHLLGDVTALLRPLLQPASGVRWLATSQEPLRVDGESVYRLAPLDVPPQGADLAELLDSGALGLFRARVLAADRGFVFDAVKLALAVELCRQLDGLPLAIEMAAARVATLGLQVVHDQIDQRLRLRTATRGAPARHHTLLQTFEWSYGLLSTVEQRVFRRLEPFAGSFSAQMAQQLCCGVDEDDAPALSSWEMLDALSALVEKSLVQRPPQGTSVAQHRLHLLESARDFARMQLAAAGETSRVRQRHAVIVADAFEQARYELERWRDVDWAAKYAIERRNVDVALRWACTAPDPALLARLVAALAELDSFAQTGAEVVRHAVPIDALQLAPMPLRARACLEFGWAHYMDGSRELGTDLLQRALADFEALGDVAGAYAALTRLVRMVRGRPGMAGHVGEMWSRLKQIDERAVPLRSRLRCHISVAFYFEGGRNIEQLWRLQRIAQSAGFDGLAASCQLHITDELLLNGRFEEAATAARSMLRANGLGLSLRALTCHNLALALVRLERFEEAHGAAQMLLRAAPTAPHLVLDLFAWAALRTRRWEDAALMAGRSAQIKRERDWSSEDAEATMVAETMGQLRDELGEGGLAELLQIGGAMRNPDVLALARRD